MHIVCFFFVTPHYCCPLHIVGLPHVVRLPASELASIFPYPFYRRPIQSLGLHEVYMRIFDPACAIGTRIRHGAALAAMTWKVYARDAGREDRTLSIRSTGQ